MPQSLVGNNHIVGEPTIQHHNHNAMSKFLDLRVSTALRCKTVNTTQDTAFKDFFHLLDHKYLETSI